MKKRMMMIATLALAIYNIVLAGDKVTINDFKISAGETKEVSVSLTNDIEYVAFQKELPWSRIVQTVSVFRRLRHYR